MSEFLDMIKVGALIGGAILSYLHAIEKISEQEATLQVLSSRSERIERYLSSQDSHYWEKINREGSNP